MYFFFHLTPREGLALKAMSQNSQTMFMFYMEYFSTRSLVLTQEYLNGPSTRNRMTNTKRKEKRHGT